MKLLGTIWIQFLYRFEFSNELGKYLELQLLDHVEDHT